MTVLVHSCKNSFNSNIMLQCWFGDYSLIKKYAEKIKIGVWFRQSIVHTIHGKWKADERTSNKGFVLHTCYTLKTVVVLDISDLLTGTH